MKNLHSINQNNKLQHLSAESLYNSNEQLIFDAKTGKHIGYTSNQAFTQTNEMQPEIIEDNQLSLFDPCQLKLF